MSNCRWYEISSFASAYDAARFEAYLVRQVADGTAEELARKAEDTRRFRCTASGEIWALAIPDDTGRGTWKPSPGLTG